MAPGSSSSPKFSFSEIRGATSQGVALRVTYHGAGSIRRRLRLISAGQRTIGRAVREMLMRPSANFAEGPKNEISYEHLGAIVGCACRQCCRLVRRYQDC